MSSTAGVGEEWNQMFQSGEHPGYIFPTSMSGSYDAMHSQVDAKKNFDQDNPETNSYLLHPRV